MIIIISLGGTTLHTAFNLHFAMKDDSLSGQKKGQFQEDLENLKLVIVGE